MPNAQAAKSGWLLPALLAVGALTAWRIALLWFDRTELFVDEAQYWFWGQELAFGYYSKPPMIGWVIRAVTELAGSDAPFWVRLPGAVFHAVTALLLGAIAARLWGATAGKIGAVLYATLPMVAVGSFLISTDTVMFPFLALALLLWLRVLGGAPSWMALAAGAALGLAALSKYAALYYVLCAGLAALIPAGRPRLRAAGLALLALLVVISPNMIWNILNGFSTLEHTLDNADWVRDPGTRAQLNLAGLAEFFGAQFIVFGPVTMLGLLWALMRWRWPVLLLFSVPIVALVCGQALLNQAYANWAAAAYLAGTLAVVPWLAARRWLLLLCLGINLIFTLAVPLLTVFGTDLRLQSRGPLLLERYLGRVEMSEAILEAAEKAGASAILSDDRDILADLFYTGRDSDIPRYAAPFEGRAPSHYALKSPYTGQASGKVLLVTKARRADPPCTYDLLGVLDPTDGAYRRHPQRLLVVDAQCWTP